MKDAKYSPRQDQHLHNILDIANDDWIFQYVPCDFDYTWLQLINIWGNQNILHPVVYCNCYIYKNCILGGFVVMTSGIVY